MRNNSFWDICTPGSIRHAIAEFIDHSPLLQHFKGEKYYKLEDALVEFIEQNRELIYQEIKQEYFRDDVCQKLVDNCGENNADIFMKYLSVDHLDYLIHVWQEKLDDYERYGECFWQPLIETLEKIGFLSDFEAYNQEERQLYAVYLCDWLSDHDIEHMSPACIDEFLSNEMQDADTAEYYKNLLKKESETHKADTLKEQL